MHLKNHFRETERLLRDIPAQRIAEWLLRHGYYPEHYVLPPSFQVGTFELRNQPYHSNLGDLARRQLETVSHPKSLLTARQFSIIHPRNYHDLVFHLKSEWSVVLDHLFHEEQKVYSYSFPIPITKRKEGRLGHLRTGRMIYEWLAMAERDLIIDGGKYQVLVRTDIVNFYGSIYTHSIAWAMHGREKALKNRANDLLGNKLDRLLQYANDARTNGIPVGPVLSDLVAEIVLSAVDLEVSRRAESERIDFVATRFKDDYRILCQSEDMGRRFLKHLSDVLSEYHLSLNEGKTAISRLPDGLYRAHDRRYFPYSLRNDALIEFKRFEYTYLIALDIHRDFPGTSILEKFVSELLNNNKELKVVFSRRRGEEFRQICKMIELLFFAKRESPKLLCHVLALCEQLYRNYRKRHPKLREFLQSKIRHELSVAATQGSVFEVVWYIFFSRFVSLGLTGFDSLVSNEGIKRNNFYKSILTSQQKVYNDMDIELFRKPRDCVDGGSLARQIAVFD